MAFWQCLAWIPLSYTSKTFKNNMYVIYSMYKYIEISVLVWGFSGARQNFRSPTKTPKMNPNSEGPSRTGSPQTTAP